MTSGNRCSFITLEKVPATSGVCYNGAEKRYEVSIQNTNVKASDSEYFINDFEVIIYQSGKTEPKKLITIGTRSDSFSFVFNSQVSPSSIKSLVIIPKIIKKGESQSSQCGDNIDAYSFSIIGKNIPNC
jgi:hypothetical protein